MNLDPLSLLALHKVFIMLRTDFYISDLLTFLHLDIISKERITIPISISPPPFIHGRIRYFLWSNSRNWIIRPSFWVHPQRETCLSCSQPDKDYRQRILDYVNIDFVVQRLSNICSFCLQQVYKWTGDNMFFIKGDMDSLAFGGGRWAHSHSNVAILATSV